MLHMSPKRHIGATSGRITLAKLAPVMITSVLPPKGPEDGANEFNVAAAVRVERNTVGEVVAIQSYVQALTGDGFVRWRDARDHRRRHISRWNKCESELQPSWGVLKKPVPSRVSVAATEFCALQRRNTQNIWYIVVEVGFTWREVSATVRANLDDNRGGIFESQVGRLAKDGRTFHDCSNVDVPLKRHRTMSSFVTALRCAPVISINVPPCNLPLLGVMEATTGKL